MESECHEIIKYELDGLRSVRAKFVPGNPGTSLYPGQSICKQMFALQIWYYC